MYVCMHTTNLKRIRGTCTRDTTQQFHCKPAHRLACSHVWRMVILHYKCCVVLHTHIPLIPLHFSLQRKTKQRLFEYPQEPQHQSHKKPNTYSNTIREYFHSKYISKFVYTENMHRVSVEVKYFAVPTWPTDQLFGF